MFRTYFIWVVTFVLCGVLSCADINKREEQERVYPKQRTEAEKMSMQPIVEEGVYICTGGHARKYHRYRGCRGLNACEGGIEKTTKQKAERVGRKPCKICY